ncbi:MAG TPA: DNA methyltransferase [Bradyrhizobium sp.]|nr:DNA methyltransferase [Bradyrhizobium sp.]
MTLDRATMEAVRRLRPDKRNARTHSKKQIKQLASVILRYGWTYPILIDENYNIICGNARWEAAKELRIKDVPVIVMSGLSNAEKLALAIADNKIAANAGWDRNLLAAELGELASLLPECNLNIEITGFEPAEIDSLVADFGDPERDPVDAAVKIADRPVSGKGDLWQSGPHRLLCGNASDESCLAALMGRDRAAMIFADPPYNVQISSTVGRGKIKHREFAFASGEMSPSGFIAFLKKWMQLIAKFSEDGSIHCVCMDWRHLYEVLAAGKEVYDELKNLVVWTKTNAGQGSFYRSQHELIFVFKNGDVPHLNNVELGRHGRNRSNVWTYAGVNTFRAGRLDELSIHPTVKPVALVADAMRDCSRRGDIILDPFMGFGTTILAAERVGRRGYGLEIDPLYVDAAIRRWQDFTRRDAILEATGQTFDEVAAARSTAKRGRAK